MKNICYLLVVVSLLAATGKATGQTKPEVMLLDSVYGSSWVNNNWTLVIKNYQSRNGNGHPVQSLFKKYTNGTGQFLDYLRYLYVYPGSAPDPTTVTDQLFYGGNWIDYQFAHYLAKDLADSSYTKNWDNQKHRFAEGLMNTYLYNDSLLPTDNTTRIWDTTSLVWVNRTRDTYTYTTDMKLSEQVQMTWQTSTSAWKNSYKYADVYDLNNLLVSHNEYEWYDSSASWVSSLRVNYYYNPTSLPNLVTKESWNTNLHVWDSLEQISYIYNQNNLLMTVQTQDYHPGLDKWAPSYLTYYTYFPSGNQQSMTGNTWDSNSLTWVTDVYQRQDSITNKLAENDKYYLDPQTFAIMGGVKDLYTFKPAGDTLTWVNQEWDVSGSSWLNKSQVLYSYDPLGMLTQTLTQTWTSSGSTWTNSRKSDYFYSDFIGIGEHAAKVKPCFYANPMVAGSTINCPALVPGKAYTLKVCSLSGMEIYQTQFRGGEPVNISGSLSSGLYFLILEDKSSILYKDKVIVIH